VDHLDTGLSEFGQQGVEYEAVLSFDE